MWGSRVQTNKHIFDLLIGLGIATVLVQIVTVFSCKLQGKRAGKARKMVEELISVDCDA